MNIRILIFWWCNQRGAFNAFNTESTVLQILYLFY